VQRQSLLFARGVVKCEAASDVSCVHGEVKSRAMIRRKISNKGKSCRKSCTAEQEKVKIDDFINCD
jgi:hypothetical protein